MERAYPSSPLVFTHSCRKDTVFHKLPPSPRAKAEAVARRTAERIETILRRHGRSLEPELCNDAPPALVSDEPGLAACYSAAAQGVGLDGDRAGRPTLRLLISPETTVHPSDDDAPVAEVRGVTVHVSCPRLGFTCCATSACSPVIHVYAEKLFRNDPARGARSLSATLYRQRPKMNSPELETK